MKDQIERILDEFPFDDVWQAMRAVGWKWGPSGLGHYPTFTALRRTAKMLLESAQAKQTRASTGGFEAIYADGILELNFVLARAATEDYDDSDMPQMPAVHSVWGLRAPWEADGGVGWY